MKNSVRKEDMRSSQPLKGIKGWGRYLVKKQPRLDTPEFARSLGGGVLPGRSIKGEATLPGRGQ
jgi:hypothetical protein